MAPNIYLHVPLFLSFDHIFFPETDWLFLFSLLVQIQYSVMIKFMDSMVCLHLNSAELLTTCVIVYVFLTSFSFSPAMV